MSSRTRVLLALLLACALPIAAAHAHGGKSHRLMGTVVSASQDRLVIRDANGADASVRLTPETRFEREGKAVDRSALAAGTRVSVHLTEDDTTAVLVKVGTAPGSR